jgi:hypothetical protein
MASPKNRRNQNATQPEQPSEQPSSEQTTETIESSGSPSQDQNETQNPNQSDSSPSSTEETAVDDKDVEFRTEPVEDEKKAAALAGTTEVYVDGVAVQDSDVEAAKDRPTANESGIQPHTTSEWNEPKGKVIREGEELTFDATEKENFAIVNENVYMERSLRGSARKTYTLVYTKGTRIPLSTLQKKE